MILPRFYPIFDSAAWLERALPLGVRLAQLRIKDRPPEDLRAEIRAGLRLGVSTHDRAELDRAMALAPDYVALGPVYPTILKQMKWREQGLDRVTEWKRLVGDTPLCAIGGMTVARAPGAFGAGADIVSAVTDITLNADPEARMRDWLRVCA